MTMTKSQAARLISQGALTETFVHATLGHFNVSALRVLVAELVRRGKSPQRFAFADVRAENGDPDPIAFLSSQREIDQARVDELTDADLEDPVIMIICPPGTNGAGETHLLVDGIHRMTGRHQRGLPDFPFWMIPYDVAKMLSADLARGINVPWGRKEVRDGRLVDQERPR